MLEPWLFFILRTACYKLWEFQSWQPARPGGSQYQNTEVESAVAFQDFSKQSQLQRLKLLRNHLSTSALYLKTMDKSKSLSEEACRVACNEGKTCKNNGVYEILVKAIHWKSLRCWRPLHDLGEAEADLHLLPVGTSLLRSRHPVVSVPAVSGRPGLCPSLGHHLVAPFLSCHPCRWHFRWFASFARSGKPLALARPELPHFLPFLPPHRKMPLHAHEPCLGVSFSAKVKNSTRSERCEQALPFKRHQSQKNH